LTRKRLAFLLLLSVAALLVHGYHPAAEDGELYLPGVKKLLNPALYPFNGEFFLSHAHMTLFPRLIALSVRVSHLPLDYAVFLWHFACIFVFLLGCWRVSRACFNDPRAWWGSVCLVGALLTIPVAGTALYIMDQYLTPRDFSTAVIMLVLADAFERRIWRACVLMVAIALVHPLMSVFGAALLVLLHVNGRRLAAAVPAPQAAAMLLFIATPSLGPVSGIYRGILDTSHAYFLVTRWQWYEWLGIAGPLALLWAIARYAESRGRRNAAALARALILFGLLSLAAALLVCIPRLAGLALLQPMRSLHLIFILLFVLLGGILGESVLKSAVWRWLALFAPLCLGMFLAQRALFPATAHLELPGATPSNPWAQAFDWVRTHTPVNAVFAMNPDYMNLAGEDEHGFRTLAERSSLANIHDKGAVSMFPALARDWFEQDQAQRGWASFQAADFERLRRVYGVTWVILDRPAPPGLACPFRNETVAVCRVE
jgi:hypothetical protein